ncbi:MAG: acetoin:2,6-dichlorophenolindophenol oxidoreductase subunit beta [Solirubrobacteraceae bacterium]
MTALAPTNVTALKYWKALNEGLAEEMDRDERVVVFGEDVAIAGGAFGVTRGLRERFGDWRVRDTPISENGIVGLAVGSAAVGLRPVAEIMFMDFSLLALDQIVNQAAKYRYFSGRALPLVVRMMCGAGGQHGAQHSQSLEAWFAQVPGLKVVLPSDAADAKGLLKSAIREDDPVIVVETLGLLARRAAVADDPETLVPIGVAATKREGTDVTVVAYGRLVAEALAAAELLAHEDVSVEVIDLRTVAPVDAETIVRSVHKTGRLVVAHEALAPCGIGAEICALVMENAFDSLDAPIERVTPAFTNVPASRELAQQRVPERDTVAQAVRRTLERTL